jgi:hypothetical protein
MIFQQMDLPPYTLSLLRFFVRQFDDFSLVFGIDQVTSHDGKFLGVLRSDLCRGYGSGVPCGGTAS